MMSDHNTHVPFDDELLSAFLDDELTPDERARVEARLAADPAARQMLDQLRAVSRAVQGLPREAVGEDLRAAILERAQAAEVENAAVLPWPKPQMSAGRTKRAWVWAGLAVAAALLVMVFQPNAEDEDGIPGVVAMRGGPEETVRELSLESRIEGELSGPEQESASASAGRSGGGGVGGGGGGLAAESAPATASTSTSGRSLTAAEDPSSGEELRRRSELAEGLVLSAPTGGGRGGREHLVEDEDADAARESDTAAFVPPPASDDEELLVVHVQLTPVAFQNKTFDSTLARCGIAVEETSPTESREPLGERSMDRATSSRQQTEQAAPSQVDVVLVDAPAAQVVQCLDELDRDTTNYLAVDIEGQPAKSTALQDKAAQADQWKQYNRGLVPAEQKALLNRDVLNAPQEKAANSFGIDLVRGRGQQNLSALRQNIKNYDQQARAMRVPIEQSALGSPAFGYELAAPDSNVSGAAPAAAGSAAATAEQSSALSRKLAKNADNLQVLFFLCPQHTPASSPPADNRVP